MLLLLHCHGMCVYGRRMCVRVCVGCEVVVAGAF